MERFPSCEATLQRPSGLIKRGRKGKRFKQNCRKDLIKVENVLQELISSIDLNSYRILTFCR